MDSVELDIVIKIHLREMEIVPQKQEVVAWQIEEALRRVKREYKRCTSV